MRSPRSRGSRSPTNIPASVRSVGKCSPELPGVKAFEGATQFVKPEDLKDSIPHGPDPQPYIQSIQKAIDAGFDHVVLLSAGPDQAAFIRFFEQTLAPELRGLPAKGQSGGKAKAAAKDARGKSKSAARKR